MRRRQFETAAAAAAVADCWGMRVDIHRVQGTGNIRQGGLLLMF